MGRRPGRHGIRKNNAFAQKKRDKKNNSNVWDPAKARQTYADTVRESEAFVTYYKKQNICPEAEWDEMMNTLKEDLPTAFRITGTKVEARAMLAVVEGQFFKDLLNAGLESAGEVKPPTCLPWYPDRLAWQLEITRKDIRRSEAYFRLHNFLISETSSGNISRQEAVSMIPPLVLDVQSHHKVLDMCAAPGSKTAQLIEMLHAQERDGDPPPTGLVMANDVDNTRCYMLVHQAKRLSSPCIVITNHDATQLPNIQVPGEDGQLTNLKFDRILCDVPCTGDGTLRKNPDIWPKWNPANGNNLHGIQYRVARRGLELLNVGGRLVYSTCSLNPVENEAVIHRILKDADGALELVDVSDLLPGLRYKQGVTRWIPCAKDLVGYERFEDVPHQWATLLRPTMFPPSEEEAPKYNLERCIRILPHLQNTGGFFVAVLHKTKLLPWEAVPKPVVPTTVDADDSKENGDKGEAEAQAPRPKSPPRKKRRMQGYKEDPFVFFEEKEELWPTLRNFYDLKPDLSPTWFLTRCKVGKKKNIYFTSASVRDVVMNNEDRIKLINTGVKAFTRCDNNAMKCCFRLAQEGLKSIVSYLGPKRRVNITKEDLILLLTCKDPRFPPEIESLSSGTQENLQKLTEQGSLVLEFRGETNAGLPVSMTLVGWKGVRSLRAYVSVSDCVHTLRLLGEDVSIYEVNKFKDKVSSGGENDVLSTTPNEIVGSEVNVAGSTDIKQENEISVTVNKPGEKEVCTDGEKESSPTLDIKTEKESA